MIVGVSGVPDVVESTGSSSATVERSRANYAVDEPVRTIRGMILTESRLEV